MKIDRSIRDLPWPEPFEGADDKQSFRLTLDWPVVDGEKLLVATFARNVQYASRPWKIEYGPDFRLVAVNTEARRDMCFLFRGERAGRRWTLGKVMQKNFDTLPIWCNLEISGQDEEALAVWLGADRSRSQNHLMGELDDWTMVTINLVKQAEADRRGELRDDDVYLCPEDLPDGLVEYIRQGPLREDYALLYEKGNVRGVCFRCGCYVRATGGQRFRQYECTVCPRCGESVLAVLEGSSRFLADYVDDVIAMQRGTDGKTIFLRQWHIVRDPIAKWDNIPRQLDEIARYAIRGNRVAKWQAEAKENWFMKIYRYRLENWERMKKVTEIYDRSYYFYLPENWRELLAGTSLQYCDLGGYIESAGENRHDLNPARLLIDWARYPAIEKFWKAGYTGLVKDRVQDRGMKKGGILWKRATIQAATPFPYRLLKRLYAPSEWDQVKVNRTVKVWRLVQAGRIKEAEAPLLVYLKGSMEAFEAALGHAPVQRVLDYMASQRKRAAEIDRREKIAVERAGQTYHGNLAAGVGRTYRDYLADCGRLGLDLDDRAVLFPPDLDAAHARTIAQIRYKANEAARKKFAEAVKKLGGLAWERDGLLIRPAMTPDELTAEGITLHHCVGGYVDRMAAGQTTILFVRRAEAPDMPYYTLEWQNDQVIQCRTLHNRSYDTDPAVHEFVTAWAERQKAKKAAKRTMAAVA